MKLPRVSTVVAAAVLAPAVLFPSSASAADAPRPTGVSGPDTAADSAPDAAPSGTGSTGGTEADGQEQRDRAEIQKILADPNTGRGVREAGEKALKGGAAELRHFLTVELPRNRMDDLRVKLAQIMDRGGPAVRAAVAEALGAA